MNRSITLNGREYSLRFSVNALCCLEEKTGVSLAALESRQVSCLRGLLWCGLMESCPGMTLSQAGDLLDAHLAAGGDLGQVAAQLSAALEDACFFHPKADMGRAAKEAAEPSGSASFA